MQTKVGSECYKGQLGKPLDPFAPSSPTEQVDARLAALMALFGINQESGDKFERLSLALAFAHVPAFRFPCTFASLENWHGQRSGRKTDLSRRKSAIVFEVENILPEVKTVTAACKKLSRRKPPVYGTNAKRIERAYYRYRNELKGFERLAGAPVSRLCANQSKPCLSGNSYVDEILTACAHPGRCRLYGSYQEMAEEMAAGASKRDEIAARLRAWRLLKEWAIPSHRHYPGGKK